MKNPFADYKDLPEIPKPEPVTRRCVEFDFAAWEREQEEKEAKQ